MRHSSRVVFLCLLSLLFSIRVFAYSDWLPINPEELKMTSVPQQPGAPAVVLYHEENDDDMKHSQLVYSRIKVLTEAGKKYGDVEIPYDSKYLEINSLRGRTIQPDGTVSNFEGKPFDRVIVRTNGVKWRVKVFTMPNVQVGSIVEYRYFRDYDDKRLFAPQWILQGPLFRVKQYFCYVPTTKDVIMRHDTVGRGVSWSYYTPNDLLPKEDSRGRIELTLLNVPAFIEEPEMPPADSFRYNVHFYYDTHRADANSFWKEEGKYWNHDVEKFIGKRGGLPEAVRSAVTPSDTPEQKARKLYAFVQSLQNLNYSPHRSEEEMRALGLKDARGVEDVLRQKMGDSEDLSRLYVAMAREAGLHAFAMRVTSLGGDSIFNPHHLRFSQLDHEIAIVKLGDKEVYLDPGIRFCPFGVLYWKHSSTQGLRQNVAKGTEIATVPGLSYSDAWLRRDATFQLTAEGQLEGTLQLTYKGQRALLQRLEYWNTDDAGRKKGLEEEVKRWLPSGAEANLTNQPEWLSDGDLVATFQVATSAGSSAGHRYLVPLDILQFGHPPHFPHAERNWPIFFRYPYRTTDHIHLRVPATYQVENVPTPVDEKLPYAIYNLKLTNRNGDIELVRDLAMAGSAFPKTSYPELKGFFDKVKAADDQQAVLKGVANDSGN